MTVATQERVGEHPDVFGPLAKRRHGDGNDRKPEIEILTEAAGEDLRFQVFVRGGDHARVDGNALPPA